jgi:hypothetical protein
MRNFGDAIWHRVNAPKARTIRDDLTSVGFSADFPMLDETELATHDNVGRLHG